MTRASLLPATILAVASAACAAAPTLDRARVEAELLRTDVEFSKTAEVRDIEAFLAFFSDDPTYLPAGAEMVTGRDAIRAAWAPLFTDPRMSITWKPLRAGAAASGDLGYTIGTYEVTVAAPPEPPTLRPGKYLTIWRKEPGGRWKATVDMGNSSIPPAAASGS